MPDVSDFSTQNISDRLSQEIKDALSGLEYGSVELQVTNGVVSQITRRYIKKTNQDLK